MILNGIDGGRGVSYGCTIKGYALESSIPATGSENDIAVVTSIPVPSIDGGGVIWSVGQPSTRTDGSGLQGGDIWILLGNLSSFPFAIVNGVTVYGITMFQYINSAWVSIEVAKIYKSGTWIPFELYLHYRSNQCIGATAGWEARAWQFASNATAYAPIITYNSDHVEIVMPDVSGRSGAYQIKEDIDLTPYTSIKIDSYGNANTDNLWLIVIPRAATYLYDNAVSRLNLIGARAVRTLDISAINSINDICIGAKHYSFNATCRMYSIKFVR